MSDTEWMQFTEEAEDRVARGALQAAGLALLPLRDQEDPEPDEVMKAILTAFQAAKQVESDANRAFKQANPDKRCLDVHLGIHEIVATALASLGNFYRNDLPYSTSGYLIVAFAHACKAMDAYNVAIGTLDGQLGAGGVENAKDLLDRLAAPVQPAP